MPAKSKINKLEALEATFGPLDPEDVSYINFLHARRHCATVPGRPGHRELAYVVELQELPHLRARRLSHRQGSGGPSAARGRRRDAGEAAPIGFAEEGQFEFANIGTLTPAHARRKRAGQLIPARWPHGRFTLSLAHVARRDRDSLTD
jgi:hypothetical protein